jgi:hypothetical protein
MLSVRGKVKYLLTFESNLNVQQREPLSFTLYQEVTGVHFYEWIVKLVNKIEPATGFDLVASNYPSLSLHSLTV